MTVPASGWLEGASPGVRGKRFDLGPDPVRLGRGSSCQIPLSDPLASREHAEIRYQDGQFTIADLGSTHGTMVDGAVVQHAVLRNGARVQLGTSEFIFRLPQDAIPTAMVGGLPGPAAAPAASAPSAPPPPPPAAPPPAAVAPAPSAAPARPRRSRKLLLGCGIALVVGLCCCLGLYLSSVIGGSSSDWEDTLRGTLGDASPSYTEEDLAVALEAPLPDERGQVLERLGRPDEFDISVVQIEGGQVRLETWSYHSLGMRVDFADGAIAWTVEIEPAGERTVFPAWYDPKAFETGMTIDEASALAAAASPAGTVPMRIDLAEGGDDLAGGEMLLGDQIMLGFQDGSLVFVETMGATLQESGG